MHEVVRLTSASNGGFVISAKETVINLVEAAYNLEVGAGDWLPNVEAQLVEKMRGLPGRPETDA